MDILAVYMLSTGVESQCLGDTKPFRCGGSTSADLCPVPLLQMLRGGAFNGTNSQLANCTMGFHRDAYSEGCSLFLHIYNSKTVHILFSYFRLVIYFYLIEVVPSTFQAWIHRGFWGGDTRGQNVGTTYRSLKICQFHRTDTFSIRTFRFESK